MRRPHLIWSCLLIFDGTVVAGLASPDAVAIVGTGVGVALATVGGYALGRRGWC